MHFFGKNVKLYRRKLGEKFKLTICIHCTFTKNLRGNFYFYFYQVLAALNSLSINAWRVAQKIENGKQSESIYSELLKIKECLASWALKHSTEPADVMSGGRLFHSCNRVWDGEGVVVEVSRSSLDGD